MKGGLQEASIAVYVILQRTDKKIACVMRSNKSWMNHHYSLLAGRAEPGESVLTAAMREAKEEGGVDVDRSDLVHVLTMNRKSRDEIWIDVFFKARSWRGEPFNAEPDEHSSLDWLDPENLPENVIPMQSDAIQKITEGLTYAEYGW